MALEPHGKVGIMVESKSSRTRTRTRNRVQRVYQSTPIPGLVITSWLGNRELFALTHKRTGRALNFQPMTIAEIEGLIESIAGSDLDWNRSGDWRELVSYYHDGLSPLSLEMMGC